MTLAAVLGLGRWVVAALAARRPAYASLWLLCLALWLMMGEHQCAVGFLAVGALGKGQL